MSKFVEEAIRRAGLTSVLSARRAGDVDTVRAAAGTLDVVDLLILGAFADLSRQEDVGALVRIHERAPLAGEEEVHWVAMSKPNADLEFLRAVASARIQARKGSRVGIDWSECGMELAQVALGFGASEMRGPIQRKSGLVILEGEKLKLKGQGMVELRTIKRQEIGALVTHAGRVPEFLEMTESLEPARERIAGSQGEVFGV